MKSEYRLESYPHNAYMPWGKTLDGWTCHVQGCQQEPQSSMPVISAYGTGRCPLLNGDVQLRKPLRSFPVWTAP
jgi:hypothetical protein